VQPRCRAAKMQFFCDRHETTQLAELEHRCESCTDECSSRSDAHRFIS
jgi:hypothetical protein